MPVLPPPSRLPPRPMAGPPAAWDCAIHLRRWVPCLHSDPSRNLWRPSARTRKCSFRLSLRLRSLYAQALRQQPAQEVRLPDRELAMGQQLLGQLRGQLPLGQTKGARSRSRLLLGRPRKEGHFPGHRLARNERHWGRNLFRQRMISARKRRFRPLPRRLCLLRRNRRLRSEGRKISRRILSPPALWRQMPSTGRHQLRSRRLLKAEG